MYMATPASTTERALASILLAALLIGTASRAAAQDPAAERLLRQAERFEQAGDTPEAITELELLVSRFADDELAPGALLRIAEIRRDRGERSEATSAADKLVTDYGLSAEAAAALNLKTGLALAEAAATEDLIEAQNSYRRVALLFGREAYPVLEARREARIASGEIALALGDPATAAAELVAAIEDEAPGPAAGRARLSLARAWLAAGEWTAAAAVLEELVAADDTTSEAAARGAARRLLSLVHRRVLRPLAGEKSWLTSGRYPPAGATLREPSGVAAAADGALLIVDERLSLVVLVGPDGNEANRQSLPDVGGPGWIDEGLPFVVAGGNVVLPFNGTSYAFNDPRRNAPLRNLTAAVDGVFGDWFVAARGLKSLLHFRNGRQGRELASGRRPDVVDVARDRQGRIYALDARAAQVLRLDRDAGGEAVHLTGDWKKAAALAVDQLGYLYVLDRGNRRVDLYSPEGRRLAQVGPSLGGGIELRNPVDIAVDGGGRLFIADTKLPFVVMLD